MAAAPTSAGRPSSDSSRRIPRASVLGRSRTSCTKKMKYISVRIFVSVGPVDCSQVLRVDRGLADLETLAETDSHPPSSERSRENTIGYFASHVGQPPSTVSAVDAERGCITLAFAKLIKMIDLFFATPKRSSRFTRRSIPRSRTQAGTGGDKGCEFGHGFSAAHSTVPPSPSTDLPTR